MPHLLRNYLLRIFLFYSTIPSCLEAEKSVEFNFSTYVIPQNFTTSRNSNVLQAGHLQKLCGTVCFIAATFPSLPLSSKQLHLWFSADLCCQEESAVMTLALESRSATTHLRPRVKKVGIRSQKSKSKKYKRIQSQKCIF